MLEQIFLKVLDMSGSASMIIVIICLVRIFLKRFPKYISYMLWSVVLFRLLCPFTLESRLSPIPDFEPVLHGYTSGENAVLSGEEASGVPAETHTGGAETEVEVPETGQAVPIQTHPEGNTGMAFGQISPEGNAGTTEVSWQELFLRYGKYAWLSGTVVLFLYCAVSTVRIRRKVSVSIPLRENIYITDEEISPFVMGMFRPRIYLPGGLGGKEQEYIILHEKFHIRRLDHVVKPVAFVALCIHWFNPLAWLAFALFGKDMEMSCDEAVIRRMGEDVRADYSASLLALSMKRRLPGVVPVDFGEGDAKGRIRNLASFRRTKKGVLAVLVAGAVILILCLAFDRRAVGADADGPGNGGGLLSGADNPGEEGSPSSGTDGSEDGNSLFFEPNVPDDEKTASGNPEAPEPLNVSLDITEHYQTSVGNPSNLFYIDEDKVLWGIGDNQCGQLGQGTQDFEFHDEPVKIAENVIDVDYSQAGFVIYLTEDHKLYGVGNSGRGALQQYSEFDWTRYVNGEHYYVSEPCLLMENVAYARCGMHDVACMTEDGAVWIWGTVYFRGHYLSHDVLYIEKPQKVLENAVLVTGGWSNHAALLRDGTVWTWGYNIVGNCGVADLDVVGEPTMVAEDVIMVWTDRKLGYDPMPDVEDMPRAWRGELKYETGYDDISAFDGVYPVLLDNTVIQKADGSYWVCGEHVGQEERMVHSIEGVDYSVICTHEFHPCE
ncbi:MAG: hypothetical protein NC123_20165 [Butyrivibrio sp.]|nr:hypothetical protein [Butyrivibrio sp.]